MKVKVSWDVAGFLGNALLAGIVVALSHWRFDAALFFGVLVVLNVAGD